MRLETTTQIDGNDIIATTNWAPHAINTSIIDFQFNFELRIFMTFDDFFIADAVFKRVTRAKCFGHVSRYFPWKTFYLHWISWKGEKPNHLQSCLMSQQQFPHSHSSILRHFYRPINRQLRIASESRAEWANCWALALNAGDEKMSSAS